MSRRRSIFAIAPENQDNLRQQDEFSNEIDQNLRTLALVHPFSDTTKSLLKKGAFLKANKPAFHHVVQYLIILINAAEFRKRFRWPIITSSDESVFRSAALTYFNDCHSLFKWNFGPFKMQIVLFPGGIEFMKIVIELSKIAMHTVLKNANSLHLIDNRGVTFGEAKAKLRATEEAFEVLEQFRSKVQTMSKPLKESTARLKELRQRVLSNSNIPEYLVEGEFLRTWELNQSTKISEKITRPLNQLDDFASKCDSFQQLIAQVKQVDFDREKLSAHGVLNESQTHFDPKIDYDKLLQWFKNAMPELISALYYKSPWSLSNLERESQILDHISSRADDLLCRINVLKMDSFESESKRENINKSLSINVFDEKLITTPIINVTAKKYHRIAIWEAVPTPPKVIQYTPRKANTDTSDCVSIGSIDSTLARTTSTKLDPMIMLSVMHRKGLNRMKNVNRRISIPSATTSPARVNNNNIMSMSPFNSTMITGEEPPINAHLFTLSPWREGSF